MEAAPDSVRRARPLLGTFVEIAVTGATIDAMEAAIEQAFAAVAAVHRLMSFHETDSDVSRLNRGAASGAVRVHDWTYQVLEAACDLNRRSAGVFDVCVAPALQRLGLLPDRSHPSSPYPDFSGNRAVADSSRERIGPHPELPTGGADQLRDKVYSPTRRQLGFLFSLSCKERARARASRRMAACPAVPIPGEAAERWTPAFAGMTPEDRQAQCRLPPVKTGNSGAHDTIQLLPDNHVRFADPAVKIDLGGIAKGFAVDRAVEALRRHGVAEGLVNAGGDLRTLGSRIYEVDIRDPRRPDRPMCRAALCNAALASSAGRFDPARSRDVAGSSIIDPATALPVKATRGAAVRAPSCIVADALTKVVMNIGEAAGPILEHYRADALFVSARGDVHLTGNWKDEVRLAA